MKRHILLPALLLALAAPLAAQDFSRVLVLGDSLTAGYQSGSLFETAQKDSYGRILNDQLGGGDFEQPLIGEPGIPQRLQLEHLVPGVVIEPVQMPLGTPMNITYPGIYNNLGIPGARAHDVVATTTACGFNPQDPTCSNPFYDLILRNFTNPAAATTALQQAVGFQPTFTVLWIGQNDVLGAALAGVAFDGVTLTPKAAYQADFKTIVDALESTGTNLVICNLGDATSIPFVTTIPPVVVNPATSEPVLDQNGQPIPLIGQRADGTIGPLPPGTRVTLAASSLLAQGIGVPTALGGTGLPLPDGGIVNGALVPGVLLYNDELSLMTSRTNELNAVIADVAGSYGIPVVDINGIFRDIADRGITYGGVEFTDDFLSGGIFSYDGIHASTFGYAVVANEIIKEMNRSEGLNLPEVDLFPYMFGRTVTDWAMAPTDYVFSAAASESLRRILLGEIQTDLSHRQQVESSHQR